MRSLNTRGRQLVKLLLFSHEAGFRAEDGPDVATWLERGQFYESQIRGVIHGEFGHRALDEKAIRGWLRQGQYVEKVVLERYAHPGEAAERVGLTPEETARVIASGEWNPSAKDR